MITKEQIETPRTPKELRQFVAEVRSYVESNPEEFIVARQKKGTYKTFVDELIPLALAADFLCDVEDKLKPVIGNQGYDVEIIKKDGSMDKIEIGKPYDGKASAEDTKLLQERGIGKFRVRDIGFGLSEISDRILQTAKDKSLKDYSDCTLMIVGAIHPPAEIELKLLMDSADALASELKAIQYKSKRVIFVIPTLNKCYEIQG